MCLVAGVDHLHAVKCLTRDLGVVRNASPFSLVRGALENLCAAFWILHPPSLRNDRVERGLRWHAKNFYDQNTALKPRGLSDNTARDARSWRSSPPSPPHKRCVQIYARGIRAPRRSRTSRRSRIGRNRCCRGDFVPAMRWTAVGLLGMSERESFPTADPGVLNIKLTTDPTRLLAPTLEAVLVFTDVVEPSDEQSRSPDFPSFTTAGPYS